MGGADIGIFRKGLLLSEMVASEADAVFDVFFFAELVGDFGEGVGGEGLALVGGEKSVDGFPVGLVHREEHTEVVAVEDEGAVGAE